MRLTLRTLLAWRDRLLPADVQQEFDEKVRSHDAARAIADQIEKLLANAELPAPGLEGKGLATSASSVAAFLDNALPSDQLEAFESNCIESSVHLGEVAECHTLLAGLANHPELTAELNDAECQRVGKRVRAHLTELADESGPSVEQANARAMRAEFDAIKATESATSPAVTVPTPAQRKSRLATLAAVLAVVVLLVLVGILGLQLFRSGAAPLPVATSPQANQPAPGAMAAGESSDEPTAKPVSPPVSEPALPVEEASQSSPPAETVSSTTVGPQPTGPGELAPTNPPAPANEPGKTTPMPREPNATQPPPPTSLASRPQVPQGTAMAIAGPAALGPQTIVPEAAIPHTDADAVDAGEENAPPPTLGQFLNDDRIGAGVVLHRSRDRNSDEFDGWKELSAHSLLEEYEDIIVPPGLSPVFEIGGVTVRMRPLTHAVFKFDDAGERRIQLLAGRLMVRSTNEAATLGLTAGGLSGVIKSGLTGQVAVEVTRMPDTPFAARRGSQQSVARILPLEQPLEWLQTQAGGLVAARPLRGLDEKVTLAAGEQVRWDANNPLVASRETLESLPAWVNPQGIFETHEKAPCEALAAAVKADAPLHNSLLELADHSRVENRMIAIETLALLGYYDPLVAFLSELPPTGLGKRNWEAYEGRTVPPALADELLARPLEKVLRERLPNDRGDIAMKLARRALQAESLAGLTSQLITLLEDEQPLLRRYAIQWLEELYELSESDRLKYRVDRPAEEREEGAGWWRNQLEKNRLTPRTAGMPPPTSENGR
jgi:cytoskeletal protein RodZ